MFYKNGCISAQQIEIMMDILWYNNDRSLCASKPNVIQQQNNQADQAKFLWVYISKPLV